MEETILQLENVDKSYPGVHALDHINLSFKKGEIHAVVGENGAGKSTMIKIISGAVVPDSGKIIMKGEPVLKLTPIEAIRKGIAVTYQELNGVPTLSAAENVFLGQPIRKGLLVDKKSMEEQAKTLFDSFGVHLNPRVSLSELSVAHQQIVEIAKAISRNCSLLIMDEPTASLTESEVGLLFKVVNNLKKAGITIIYISHKLEEVFKIADRITVLRDGKHIKTMNACEIDQKNLIRLMVGRDLDDTYPKNTSECGAVCLEVHEITGNGVKPTSFYVKEGEILGVAGLVGAGRTELARLIYGADRKTSGRVEVNKKEVTIKRPADAIKAGIVLIPEDRKRQGLFLEQSVYDNTIVASLKDLSKGLTINKNKAKQRVEEHIHMLSIKTPSIQQLVKNLSGGNQQKIVLAKWLLKEAKVIIFDEPTRGIDVGAKQEIYHLMRKLNQQGKAIIMISSDMNELIGMSDRVIVLYEGAITGHLEKKEISSKTILALASGMK